MHTVPVPFVIPQAPPNREKLLRTVEHGSDEERTAMLRKMVLFQGILPTRSEVSTEQIFPWEF